MSRIICYKFRGGNISILLIFLASIWMTACFPTSPINEDPPQTTDEPTQETTSPYQEMEITETPLSSDDQGVNQFLTPPTVAPTATPGFIYEFVERAVGEISQDSGSFLGLTLEDWINLVISVLIVVISVVLLSRLIIVLLIKVAKRTPIIYDEIYFRSIRKYISWLLTLIALEVATRRLQFLSPELKQWLSQIYLVIGISFVTIILWKFFDTFTLWYREKTKDQDRKEKEAVVILVERGLRFLLISVAVIVVLDNLGFNVSALLAALGIGGLAISLAAQDTIANMISGVIILVDQPFRVNDRIEIQGLDTWGDVVDIGIRSTRIRTLDNRLVIVPNSSISRNQVVNYTYPDPRYRIQTEIGVAYGSDLRLVRSVITQALYELEEVLKDKPVDVLFLEFGDSAMVLRVRWWIESYTDARRNTDTVNEAMYKALVSAQIELPAPMMQVEIKKQK